MIVAKIQQYPTYFQRKKALRMIRHKGALLGKSIVYSPCHDKFAEETMRGFTVNDRKRWQNRGSIMDRPITAEFGCEWLMIQNGDTVNSLFLREEPLEYVDIM